MDVQIGMIVETPRYGRVKIETIFSDLFEAQEAGYVEPSDYSGAYKVYGKSRGLNKLPKCCAIVKL